MARNIITSLDIGTSSVRTVVVEFKKGADDPHVLGVGVAPSVGIRRGLVVDIPDAISSIRQSIDSAQRSSGVTIKSVWLAVGGAHISEFFTKGVIAVSRADQEISPEDAKRAVSAAEAFIPKNSNKEVLHVIPRDYKVDNEAGIKNPVGMHGVRLEVDTLIVECSSPFLKNLLKCTEGAGLRVEDYVFSSLASSEVALTKRQKELGVMLLDIGGGTTSFVVFEEGTPIHAGVLPVGGNHITNDIAIGLQIKVDIAERIKIVFGSCLPDQISKREIINITDFEDGGEDIEDKKNSADNGGYSRRELARIIAARLGDIFELAGKELKKIGRTQLLPAGLVLTGGSSLIPGILEFAKKEMKLPAETVSSVGFGDVDEKLLPTLSVSLGLVRWGEKDSISIEGAWGGRVGKLGSSNWLKWLQSFLP